MRILKHWLLWRDNDAASDAALINASGQIATAAINYGNATSMTSRARKYNMEMYDKARKDALADRDWQAEYNSPASQMARLKAAGLNPNLVYGSGTDAAGSAPPVRGTEAKSWNPNVPDIQLDGSSVLGSFYDARLKEQTINNMEKQAEVMEMEKLLKAAQTTSTNASTALTVQNTGQKGQLFAGSLTAQELANQKMVQDMDIARQTNARAATMQGEQILNMIQQRSMNNLSMDQMNEAIQLLQKDNRVRELDAQFADKGIRPTDNMMWKVIGEILQKVTGKSMWDILPHLDILKKR